MPLVPHSTYQAPFWLPGGHLQTIFPALLRTAPHLTRQPERLELADGDFLDLEWFNEGRPRLAILSHGLEASASSTYIQAMAAALIRQGWDVLAWNYRSCSAEMNRLPRFYHSGATEDLHAVIQHALSVHPASQLDLIGFSLGGNMTLKLLGECADERSPRLHRAVTFSVPCDLACSSKTLGSLFNRSVYMKRFIASLTRKIRAKQAQFPDLLDPAGLKGVRTFKQFDDRYTAPLHGFRDAEDYWARSSSRQFLSRIRIPTLLVNAANDPFLGPGCYPRAEAAASDYFHLEIPATGGHVGFSAARPESWIESRTIGFLSQPENGKTTP
jgi:uncharacterized protein